MTKKPLWWQNPQTLISCLIGVCTLGGWIVAGFVADAKQAAKLEVVEKTVAEQGGELKTHDAELEQGELRQQLIMKDIESIQATQQLILDAVKKR